MKHFAVIGRECGDGEDTCMVFECATSEEARGLFRKEIREQTPYADESKAPAIFINYVLSSDAPIEMDQYI